MFGKESAHRHADANAFAADAENFHKTAVEKNDPEFGIEHAKALRHLTDRNRVQRKDGVKFVDSVLASCSLKGSCHFFAAGPNQLSNINRRYLASKTKFRVNRRYPTWLTNA